MQNMAFNQALMIQPKTKDSTAQGWKRCEISILLGVGGGLFFSLLGFFLLAIFALNGRSNSELNYGGIGVLIIAFIFFGASAHFMDKLDENMRRCKRDGIENFNKQK